MKEALPMIKKQGPFLWVLGVGLLVFFGPIFFAGKGFYYGDYKQQFYPWAWYLYKCVRHFSLPLWAPETGCGFPLLAEGQAGALYPLHWFLYSIFPFRFAYHFCFIFYFFLSGLFVYLVARQFRVSGEGAALAAAIFLFSSSYAGLVFGLASLRTLASFPLSLYCVGLFFEKPESRAPAACLALSLALGFLGGYFPMMPYLITACCLYFLYGLCAAPRQDRTKLGGRFLLALFLALGVSAAQLLPTWELVNFSARANAPLNFALQKSFSPLNLATLLWPGTGSFLGFDFYLGILPLCLALFAALSWRADRRIFFFVAWTLFFILLGFGRYNPLYVAFLKLSGFHFLRTPSKALIFSSFSMALLAGLGFDKYWSLYAQKTHSFNRFCTCLFLAAVVFFLAFGIFVRNFTPQILLWGENYVRQVVVGKFGHPYSLETYLARLPEFLRAAGERTSFTHPYALMTLGIWISCLVFIFAAKRWRIGKNAIFVFAALLILTDLFFYTRLGSGFIGNTTRPETLEPDRMISRILSSKGLFRVYERIGEGEAGLGAPCWLPNANLLFGYSSVGIYSPLAIDAYREYLKPLGSVDNATGFYPTSKELFLQNRGMLDCLNVRYVISKETLKDVSGASLLLLSESGDGLYENLAFLERTFLVKPVSLNEEKKEASVSLERARIKGGAEITRYSSTKINILAKTDESSFLFMSELYYPGWKAFLDGNPAAIYKVNHVFRGIKIPSGTHEVKFVYHPLSFYWGVCISLLSAMGCGVCLFSEK